MLMPLLPPDLWQLQRRLRRSKGDAGAALLARSPINPALAAEYQIAVRSQAQASTVTVLDKAGAPARSADAQRIVKVLADELK